MATERSDSDLLLAWAEGDRHAGAKLFDRHFSPMSRFFANKVGDEADDLIQQTFLGCAESRDRYRADASFRTFLFGIARNVLHNHYRSKGRSEGRSKDDPDFSVASIVALDASASTVLAIRGERRALLEALRSIPLASQVVLELVYWERLTAREVAEIVDAPEGTVRSRLKKAKELLAAELVRIENGRVPLESTLLQLDDWAEAVRLEAFDEP